MASESLRRKSVRDALEDIREPVIFPLCPLLHGGSVLARCLKSSIRTDTSGALSAVLTLS